MLTQLRNNITMNIYFPGTQKSSILGGLDGPVAPEGTPRGGAQSAPPVGVVSGAPGAFQTPQNRCFLGPGKIGFHDHIDTKVGWYSTKGY